MERIQALIDKLYQQKQQNSNPAQLLLTVQLLQSELLKLQQRNGTLGTAKVAVTLPVNMNFSEEVIRPSAEEVQKTAKVETAPAPTPAPPAVKEPAPVVEVNQAAATQAEYLLKKPAVAEQIEEPISKYAPRPQQVLNPAFSETADTPVLAQHQSRKELHEVIAEKKESMNDRLKEEKKEVVHSLKETPTFVSELFRGDDAMYERSIKTINGFHILSEAEYWINRELKFKLGWNDSKDVVQHFYHLVRRRFS